MIDHLPPFAPGLLDELAEGGSADALRDAFSGIDGAEPSELDVQVDHIRAAVTQPRHAWRFLHAHGSGLEAYRAFVTDDVALLHADGTDREHPAPMVAATTGSTLAHLLLQRVDFGPRPTAGGDPIELPSEMVVIDLALGRGERADELDVSGWWCAQWRSAGTQHRVAVLDTAQGYLLHDGLALTPLSSTALWWHLAPWVTHS